jgi:hypothetical protein
LVGGRVNDWCSIAAVGTEYKTLATATKGTILDLCQEDWSALLNQLAAAIITKEAKRDFKLTHKPADPLGVKVSVAGVELAASSWQYDPTANTLTIVAASAPKDGEQLTVVYKK